MAPATPRDGALDRNSTTPATWDAQEREADVAQAVSEGVTGIRVVKAFGQEDREIDRMAALSSRLYAARMRLTRIQSVFQPVLASLSTVAHVVIVLLGGWFVLRHQISLGTFAAFSVYSSGLVATVSWFSDTAMEMQEDRKSVV